MILSIFIYILLFSLMLVFLLFILPIKFNIFWNYPDNFFKFSFSYCGIAYDYKKYEEGEFNSIKVGPFYKEWKNENDIEIDLQRFADENKLSLLRKYKIILRDGIVLIYFLIKYIFYFFKEWELKVRLDYCFSDYSLSGNIYGFIYALTAKLKRIKIIPNFQYRNREFINISIDFNIKLRLIRLIFMIFRILKKRETWRFGFNVYKLYRSRKTVNT